MIWILAISIIGLFFTDAFDPQHVRKWWTRGWFLIVLIAVISLIVST
jgi:membrane protein DedA with SNARE-associated domain